MDRVSSEFQGAQHIVVEKRKTDGMIIYKGYGLEADSSDEDEQTDCLILVPFFSITHTS